MEKELLQLAKTFENMTLTKKDAVNKFGSEGQKNHFEKNGRFKSKEKEKPFLRTLNQLFDSVEFVKEGRKVNYKLGNAREEVAERESKNETNGKWSNSTKHLDALILAHLQYNIENYKEIEKSIVDWMSEFKMINQNSYNLYRSKFNEKLKESTLDLIRSSTKANNKVVDASYKFIQNDIRKQRGTLESSLKRMEKHNIVETFDRPKAYLNKPLKNEDGEEKFVIDIDIATYKAYRNKLISLKEKYELDNEQLHKEFRYHTKEVKQKVRSYHRERRKYLEEVEITDTYGNVITVSISHMWIDLAIIVSATKKKTMDYLHKFHAEVLKDYQEYKEEKYLSKQANDYKSKRKEEKFSSAESIKDKAINHSVKRDEERKSEGGLSNKSESHYEKQARESKAEFMKAMEILDSSFGDKFIIDEKMIKKVINS